VYLGNPPPEDQLYDDYYRSSDPDPDLYRTDSGDPHLRELHAINSQRIARIHHIMPAARLLDIGCGRGQFLKTAQEHGYEAYGIDVSGRAVGYAREHFGVRCDVRSLEEVSASTERFDLVTLWHVLEHFVRPLEALGQVRRILRPGGLCVIEVPNLRSLKFMLSGKRWEGGNHPLYHRTFFTSSSLRQVLGRSGYTGVRRVRWSYEVPGRSGAYEGLKRALDVAGLDAFLDFTAWNELSRERPGDRVGQQGGRESAGLTGTQA
jgi:SAM-dependent methyltransferase